MSIPDHTAARAWHFKRLKWSLQELAIIGSRQQTLFPDRIVEPGELAFDFDHWRSIVCGNYEGELSTAQAESLAALAGRLDTMRRDSAEFEADLWTRTAPGSSDQWANVRTLATSALEAFGWALTEAHGRRDDGAPAGRAPEFTA
jgi:hypothetical protein